MSSSASSNPRTLSSFTRLLLHVGILSTILLGLDNTTIGQEKFAIAFTNAKIVTMPGTSSRKRYRRHSQWAY